MQVNLLTALLVIVVFFLGLVTGVQIGAAEKRGLKLQYDRLIEIKNKALEKAIKDLRVQQSVIEWNGFPTENEETIKRVKLSLQMIERDIDEFTQALWEKLHE